LIRKRVGAFTSRLYFPGAKVASGKRALDGYLIARLLHLFRGFLELHHLIFALFPVKLNVAAGLVGDLSSGFKL